MSRGFSTGLQGSGIALCYWRERSAWWLKRYCLWQGSATYGISAKVGGGRSWVSLRYNEQGLPSPDEIWWLSRLSEFRAWTSLPHKEEQRSVASSLSEAVFPCSHWAPSSAVSFLHGEKKKVVWHTALEKMLTRVLHLTLPWETSMVVEFSYIRACVPNPVNLCVC